MANKVLFTCEFCGTHFKTERGYLKHHCKQMQREEDFKSMAGQAAFGYYKDWIVLKHHSRTIAPDAFKSSSYFTSFFKFYNLVRCTQMPDVPKFIKLMVRKKIEPKIWCHPNTYGIYLEYITYQLSLDEHVEITINTLFKCAEAADVDVSKVFNILTANDVIQLLRQRNLSPWFLLKSKKFADFVRNRTTGEEKIIMEALIKPDHWAKKYKNNPRELKMVIEYLSEMGI